MLAKLNKLLTPPRRKAIYALVAAVVAALIAFDAVSADQLSGTIQSIVTILGGLASIMALVNVSPGPNDGNPNPSDQ